MKLLKTILLTATALLGSVAAKAQCTVTVDNMTGEKGSTINMSVCLNNGDLSILGFQCDIEYPEGALAGEPETTNRAPKHTIDTSDESKNPITYMLVSLKNL
ncbi:MAG: hypothetical protein HUK02_03140, partial [Bacteroidaceae bacterium]|nr:hypothetical protein [Bacteroidaceae bacterium]